MDFSTEINYRGVDLVVSGIWQKPTENRIFPDIQIDSVIIKGVEMIEEISNISPNFSCGLVEEISQNYDKYLI